MCVLVRGVCVLGCVSENWYISFDIILHHFWTQDINWHLVSYKLLINWSNGCYLNPLPSDLRHFNIPNHLPFWNAAFSGYISYLLKLWPQCLSLLCILPFIGQSMTVVLPLGSVLDSVPFSFYHLSLESSSIHLHHIILRSMIPK